MRALYHIAHAFATPFPRNITKNFLRLARARAPGTVVFGAVVSGTVVSCVVGLGRVMFCFVWLGTVGLRWVRLGLVAPHASRTLRAPFAHGSRTSRVRFAHVTGTSRIPFAHGSRTPSGASSSSGSFGSAFCPPFARLRSRALRARSRLLSRIAIKRPAYSSQL